MEQNPGQRAQLAAGDGVDNYDIVYHSGNRWQAVSTDRWQAVSTDSGILIQSISQGCNK